MSANVRRIGLLSLFFFLASGVWAADQTDHAIGLINDANVGVDERLAAIELLGEIGDDRAVTVLAEQARSSDIPIRFSAIKSLGRIGSEASRNALNELASSDVDEDTRRGTLLARAMAKDPDVLATAKEMTQADSWQDRWYGVLALDLLGDEEAKPVFEEALEDPYQLPDGGRHPVREAAEHALERLRSSIPWLDRLDSAMAKAKISEKPLFAYFYINGGEWCEHLEKESFTREEIRALLGNFETVRVNAYVDHAAAETFQITGTPTVIIFDKDGNEFARLLGYISTERLKSYLEESLDGVKNRESAASEWVRAQGLIDQGNYEAAIPLLESFLYKDTGGVFLNKEESAEFMLALAYAKTERYEKSEELFVKFLGDHKDSPLADKALYCLALSELHLKAYESARKTLTDLIARFPRSTVVPEAETLLQQLGKVA